MTRLTREWIKLAAIVITSPVWGICKLVKYLKS